jgi:ribonuclease HI
MANQVSGSGNGTNSCWKKLWKMPVPPKVKSFWWRVIKKFIPARSILKHRHMEHIEFCEACGKSEETIHHALFECTWAKLFWHEMRTASQLKLPIFHPHAWAMDMIDNSTIREGDSSMIMCGCWAIWKERNARKHGESRRSVTESVRWVLETTIDLARTGKEKAKKSPKTKARWLPPAAGFLKINTDASFMDDTLSGSTGLVIRNHQGNLVYAQAIWYEHAASARSVEALAIRDAIRLATDRSYNQIIVESDSTEAVNMCAGDEQVRSELLPICQEIRELKRAFTSCSIFFYWVRG